MGRAVPIWVLDTNVLLDWLVFADPGVADIASWIENGRARAVTRSDCRAELVRVLAYPRLCATDAQRAAALSHFDHWVAPAGAPSAPSAPAALAAGIPRALPQCRDRDDQKFLELARDANADWLISKDRLVLKLARPMRRLPLFRIVHPREASAALSAAGPAAVS